MNTIVVGDLHAKNKEPYRDAVNNFFRYLLDNHIRDGVSTIFLGDLFDSSSPHNEVREEIANHLSKFNDVIILQGNHDYSRRMGSALEPLTVLPNVTVIDEVIEIDNCLYLPYKYDMSEYENLTGEYDYIFTHITPPECAFADEGIKLNLKGIYIHGHTHIQTTFTSTDLQCHNVIGVPIPTRHLEEKQKHRVFKIKHHDIVGIPMEVFVPQTFTFETIEFGEEPIDKNNIINIINAPSYKDVYERYKDFYIRESGIELSKIDNDVKVDLNDNITIQDKFMKFAQENNITNQEITSLALHYLEYIK